MALFTPFMLNRINMSTQESSGRPLPLAATLTIEYEPWTADSRRRSLSESIQGDQSFEQVPENTNSQS